MANFCFSQIAGTSILLSVICGTMSAILAFLATATFNPIFDPKFAPIVVQIANEYFHQPSRLIVEMTNDPYSVFASEAIKGHNALVTVQKLPLPPVDSIKEIMNGKFDFILFLGPPQKNETGAWAGIRWNPGGRVIVVTQGSAARALEIISLTWQRTRTESVLVAAINNEDLELYQWSPYRIGECSNVMTVDLLNTWKNGKFTRNNSFYMNRQLSSLNGCDLLFSTADMYPFVFENYTAGIEIKLLHLLAASFNFSPHLVAIPETMSIYSAKIFNGTDWVFSGPWKMLYEHKLDIVFAGLTAHIDRYAASTPVFPHMMENVVWTVPAPRILSPIQNTFRALSPSSWFLIMLSLLLGSFAVYMTRDPKCLTYRICFFYTLGTLLNSTPSSKTSNWHLRIITTGIIILAMHFFIAYQSTLIILLTTPILEKPYKSLKDVMDANLTCYSYSAGSRLLLLQQDEDIPRIFYTMNGSIRNYFHEIAYNRTAYLLMPETPTNVFAWGEFEDDNERNLLSQLKSPFMFLPVSFFMAPSHPLASRISEKILQMVDCGLVDFWKDFTMHTKYTTARQHIRKLQPLSINHLMGAFAVVLVALAVSVIAFVIEVLANKFARRLKKPE